MSDRTIREPTFQEQIAAFEDRIAPYQGGRASVEYYVSVAGEMRITVQNDEQTCIIFCKWCRSLQMNGPLHWDNCHFTIHPQPSHTHHTDVVIADERTGFAVCCSQVHVILPGETGFQSKELTALAVLDQMPFVINDLRHHLGGITGALNVLRMAPSRRAQPLTSEDHDFLVAMAWECGLRLRDEIDRLLASTAYHRDATTQETPVVPDVPGYIASIMSHELKTPLYSARGCLQLLYHRLDRIPVDLRDEFIADALRAVERAWTVTDDICRMGYRQVGEDLLH